MTIYAIGDLQGCLDPLKRLLDRLGFEPGVHRLWFTGDLVNRGPDSVATLRFVKSLGEAAVTVLGNHDLHLLAVAEGFQAARRGDTMQEVLDAPDAAELLAWLRHRPLIHHDAGHLLIHAGLPPQWDLDTALACAREVEAVLRGADYRELLRGMYGNEPAEWQDELAGLERWRFTINALTRLRYCTPEGRMDFRDKGAPGTQAAGLVPWFEAPGRKSAGLEIICGHWSTLGQFSRDGVHSLDTGCVWGGRLSALALDTHRFVSVDCPGAQRPGAPSQA